MLSYVFMLLYVYMNNIWGTPIYLFVYVVYVHVAIWLHSHVCRGQRKVTNGLLSLSVLYSREMRSLELGWYPLRPVTLLSPSSPALGLEVDISDHAQSFYVGFGDLNSGLLACLGSALICQAISPDFP